jgi:thioredoxin 1
MATPAANASRCARHKAGHGGLLTGHAMPGFIHSLARGVLVHMAMPEPYLNPGPARDEVDATSGPILLEFGTAWCGHCQAAAPAVAEALAERPDVEHIKVEDGPGRRLGRSFRVKLWPTFIVLKDGVEMARVVRPERTDEVRAALARTLGAQSSG